MFCVAPFGLFPERTWGQAGVFFKDLVEIHRIVEAAFGCDL